MDRELIERVVAEVIKKLSSSNPQSFGSSTKPSLLVVGELERLDSQVLEKMESKWYIKTFDSIEKLEVDLPKKVLFLTVSQDLMVKGALGICDSPESELLARCLLEGIQVFIIPSTNLYKYLVSDSPFNSEYISQLQSYKNRLEKFGVSFESLEQFINDNNVMESQIKASRTDQNKRNLLTQREVQAYNGKRIDIDQRTIVTPLARDAARQLGITIHVKD